MSNMSRAPCALRRARLRTSPLEQPTCSPEKIPRGAPASPYTMTTEACARIAGLPERVAGVKSGLPHSMYTTHIKYAQTLPDCGVGFSRPRSFFIRYSQSLLSHRRLFEILRAGPRFLPPELHYRELSRSGSNIHLRRVRQARAIIVDCFRFAYPRSWPNLHGVGKSIDRRARAGLQRSVTSCFVNPDFRLNAAPALE